MANAKSYNELRSANLHENRRMLAELGVRMPKAGEKVMLNKPKLPPRQPKQRIPVKVLEPDPEEDNDENKSDELGRSASRSFRVRLRPKHYQEEEGDCIFDPPIPIIRGHRPPPSYGKIPGVEVGREWLTRMACSEDLIHRPTVAGIHGGSDGAYSVALSGGYEDDVDFGESFTYTGEGGRDLKGTKDKPKNLRTAPQSKDQSLDRGNLALARSVETQNPVRVVRGYKLDSQYAPEEGYRYDGLYLVKKYWVAIGKSGYKVWKFAFVRCDSEPAPWVQMLLGNLGSPTSPTTPASIPRTGVEACEAPSLDADDCEDYLQLEEAQIGAKQPDDRKRVKKKVSFNSKNYIKYYEKEEPERVATRSSRAKAVKDEADNVPDDDVDSKPAQLRKQSPDNDAHDDNKPAQLCKRSQRTVKPTAKVLDNYSRRGDQGPPKLVVSASPVVLITDLSLTSIPNLGEAFKKIQESKEDELPKKKSLKQRNEGGQSPKKYPAVFKSPKMDKCSPVAPDLQAKGKTTPEKKSGRQSPESEKSRKNPLSSSVREKPKSSESLLDEVPRKRSTPPDYSVTHGKPSLSESSTDEVPRKRSISPDYSPSYEKPTPSKTLADEVPKKRSISPDYSPSYEKPRSSKSSTDEGPRKRSISPDYSPSYEKPRSSKTLADEVPRKRSISPNYSVTHEKPSSSESSTDEVPRKRSISPEYLPEDELRKKQSSGRAEDLSVSPPLTPADGKTERRGRPRKYPLSPPPSPSDKKKERRGRPRKYPLPPPSTSVDEKTERRGRPRKYPLSPPSSPVAKKKETRGRPRKHPLSPPSTPADENTDKSPKSVLKDDRPKRSPTDKKPKKSPKSTPEENLVERPVSPEYPPEDERSVDMLDLSAQEETESRSVSPQHQRKKFLSGSPPKKSPKSRDSSSKDAPKKQSLSPAHRPKYLDKQSKSPRSSLPEKFRKNSKSPVGIASKKSPKSAEGSKQIGTKKSKKSPSRTKVVGCSPKRGLARGSSPKKNNSLSKQSPGISKSRKSPKSSDISTNKTAFVKKSAKSNSPEKSAARAEKSYGRRTQSPKDKTNPAGSEESKSRKRSISSDEESVDIEVPVKKSRVSSSKSSCETLAEVGKTVVTENDEVEGEEILESDPSSKYIDDAPLSPESMENEAPMECESEDPPNLRLSIEPETKKGGKEVPDTLTPPETETSNSNSSSPNPTPPSSVSSPTSSASASRVSVNDKPFDILDNDEFPSDEEILNMMQFSLGACSSDGPKIVVKMVNGKWIEMEENDTATNANAPR